MKSFDDRYRAQFGTSLLAGTDEAGRGPLAGPVVAAAVIFPPDFNMPEINDSKKLTDKKRRELLQPIVSNALSFAVVTVSPEEIDRINILKASLKAMKQAVERLNQQPGIVLVDGNKKFDFKAPLVAVVKGDSRSLSVAAASILAKVERDDEMIRLDEECPQFGWAQNKGYPTRRHIEALQKYGFTKYHRKTFIDHIVNPGFF